MKVAPFEHSPRWIAPDSNRHFQRARLKSSHWTSDPKCGVTSRTLLHPRLRPRAVRGSAENRTRVRYRSASTSTRVSARNLRQLGVRQGAEAPPPFGHCLQKMRPTHLPRNLPRVPVGYVMAPLRLRTDHLTGEAGCSKQPLRAECCPFCVHPGFTRASGSSTRSLGVTTPSKPVHSHAVPAPGFEPGKRLS